jgi:hypothetical protein
MADASFSSLNQKIQSLVKVTLDSSLTNKVYKADQVKGRCDVPANAINLLERVDLNRGA